MPLPSQIHIDKFLTNHLIGTRNENYIADMVLPVLNPRTLSGKIAKMGREQYRIDFSPRAPGQRAYTVNWSATSVSFQAQEWSVEHPIDDQTKSYYDDPFDAYREGTMIVNDNVWLKVEDLVASLVMTNTNYVAANRAAGPDAWNTTGTPVQDVQVAIETIISTTGTSPNNIHGVCGYPVFKDLQTNAEVQAAYSAHGVAASGRATAVTPSEMTADKVAKALGLASLQVGTAVKNTAQEGATESMSWVWGNSTFAVYYKTPTPSIMRPNFGYIIAPRVEGMPGGATVAIDRYREEKVKSDYIRATALIDEIVGDNTLGYHFANTLDS